MKPENPAWVLRDEVWTWAINHPPRINPQHPLSIPSLLAAMILVGSGMWASAWGDAIRLPKPAPCPLPHGTQRPMASRRA